jgi:hypothetical protein
MLVIECFHFGRFIEDVTQELVLLELDGGTVDDVRTNVYAPPHGELLVLLDLLVVVVDVGRHQVLVIVIQYLEDVLHML